MAGSKQEQAPATGAVRSGNPAVFTLVHSVSGAGKALFPPTRLMNPVTYLGRTKGNDR